MTAPVLPVPLLSLPLLSGTARLLLAAARVMVLQVAAGVLSAAVLAAGLLELLRLFLHLSGRPGWLVLAWLAFALLWCALGLPGAHLAVQLGF